MSLPESAAHPLGARDAVHAESLHSSQARLVPIVMNDLSERCETWPLDDSVWHASLRRQPGTALERVLRLGRIASAAPLSDVFLRLRLPGDLAVSFLSSIESRRLDLSGVVDPIPAHDPWMEPDMGLPALIEHLSPTMPCAGGSESPRVLGSVLAARAPSISGSSVPAWVGLLALLEDFVCTWDDAKGHPHRAADAVYRREGFRCMAPGCTSRQNLEDHHIVYLSRRGSDELFNRLCLCRFHHQVGEHGDLANCRGIAPLGVRWTLGREGIAGSFCNERRVT